MGLELERNKTSYFIEFEVMYNYKINPPGPHYPSTLPDFAAPPSSQGVA